MKLGEQVTQEKDGIVGAAPTPQVFQERPVVLPDRREAPAAGDAPVAQVQVRDVVERHYSSSLDGDASPGTKFRKGVMMSARS